MLDDFRSRTERTYQKAHAAFVQPVEQKWNRKTNAANVRGVEATQMIAASGGHGPACIERCIQWGSASGCAVDRVLALEKGQKVVAPESPLSPLPNAVTSQTSRVRPASQRRLTDVQECGGLTDIQQLALVGSLTSPQGFTQ